ncbi:MAG: UvrD-helicase domain-containing protein, partial [Planctomycetota bacterium]
KLDLCADFAEQGRLDELAEETLILNIAKARRTATEIKLGRSTFPEDLNEAFDVLYEAVKSSCLRTLSAQNTATGSLLEIYESQITTLKNSQRSLGFDDVAVRLAKHFQSLIQQSNGRLIDHRMDGAIDHLLLDEFQDTSPVQWNVLRPIAERTTVGDRTTIDGDVSVPRSFFCVGDTKQAIYGFRGGVAEIFDAVTDQLDGVEEIAQNESYRSSPVVLDFVTEVFQHLHLHPSVADPTGDPADPATHHAESIGRFSRDFPGHFAARKKLPGHVQVVSSASKSDLGTEAKSDDLKSSRFDSAAGLVQDLHQQAPTIDIGILTRSRAAAAEMMWRLDQRGLLVSQEGGNPLTDSAAVELVLSTLMMVEHPGDRRWHFHVSNSPIRDKVFGDTMEDVENACAELRERLTDEGLVATVVSLADAIVPYCDPTDTIRLKQLSQLATGYQPTASPRLRDFVRMVRSKGVEQPKAAKIRVMTIHASKGLEFDAVVLPDLDAPLVRPSQTSVMDSPSIDEPPRGLTRYLNKKKRHFLSRRWQDAFGRQDSADMTEALCLMYVAMTRAKHSLQLVVQPMTKRDSATKSAASLVLHSLKSIKDPTASQTLLYESGSPNWHESFSTRDEADSSPESSTPAQVTFRAGSSQAIGQS